MAATALSYERQGTLSAVGSRSADLVDKTMDLYLKREEKVPLHMAKYFSRHSPKTTNFKLTTIGSELTFPRERTDTSPIPYVEPPPGYDVNWDMVTYQSGIKVTEALSKFELSGQLGFICSGLPASFRKFYEYAMANVVETASSTAGADGSYGYGTDHYLTGLGAGTWSNVETGAALSSTSVNSMAVSMANRKDQQGFVSGITLMKIIGPPALREKLVQISQTDKVPESNVNAVNAYKGIDYEVIPYFTTSSTAFYGIGDLPEARNGLHLIEWQAPKITGLGQDPNQPLIVKRFHGYARFQAGLSVIYNSHRNAGA